jgi:hypothetical protein
MHVDTGNAKCWKCGKHSYFDCVKKLCNLSDKQVFDVLKLYKSDFKHTQTVKAERKTVSKEVKACVLPKGTKPMLECHREYLRERNFDAEFLEQEWNLQGVGVVPGSLFSMRIIIPITHEGTIVSYQGRDITGDKDRIRYRTCKKAVSNSSSDPDRNSIETRFHKHCLYGLDKVKGNSVVVTEGVSKVWRLGIGAVATFGIEWLMEHAYLLAKFKNVFILFDQGEDAQRKAQELAEGVKLAESLIGGKHIEIIELDGDIKDPGDLPQKEADQFMKELGF